MLLKTISFQEPQDNLLYDDALLRVAEEDLTDDILRLWESPIPFIVLGRVCKAGEDLILENVIKDSVPVLRRSSGGGTVLQGPGCYNFSLVLKKDRHPRLQDLHQSYQYILGRVSKALRTLDISTVFRPISDLVLQSADRKISGNAQRRCRNYILHHGTLLYGMDLDLIARYLKMPQSVPEYRRGREHLDFVTRLSCTGSQLRDTLIGEFSSGQKEEKMTEREKILLEKGLSRETWKVDLSLGKAGH